LKEGVGWVVLLLAIAVVGWVVIATLPQRCVATHTYEVRIPAHWVTHDEVDYNGNRRVVLHVVDEDIGRRIACDREP
jgi:hypothetical protein